MKSAQEWLALWEDGASRLNDPQVPMLDIIREIQREAFDYGALAMKMASGDKVSGLSRANIATICIEELKGRP